MTVEPDIVEPMPIEKRLRDSLQARAASVSPSPDGWTAISLKLDRRRHQSRVVVFAFAALLPVLAVGATLAAVRQGNGPRPVDTAGLPATLAPSTTTAPAAVPVVSPTITVPTRGTTTVPRGAAAPTATRAGTARIWPETQAQLDEQQRAFDQGHQPWRGSPVDVAKAFLEDRGLGDPQMTDPGDNAGPSQLDIPYVAGGVGGTVSVAQTRDGGIYYVTRNTTDRISQIEISREGTGLVLEISSPATGTVSARTKQPGGSWSKSNTQPVVPGGQSRMLVGVGQSGDLILQVRHEGADGKVGIADQYVAAKATTAPPAENLGDSSKLRVDGFGPVRVDMTLGEAEAAAGVPMTRRAGPNCTELTPTGGPEGVAFVSTAGEGRVDVITVSQPGIETASGIGVGSTVAEVEQAYSGSLERRLTNDEGRLIHRANDPALSEFELVIGVGEGKVTQLWAGHKGLSLNDEICA